VELESAASLDNTFAADSQKSCRIVSPTRRASSNHMKAFFLRITGFSILLSRNWSPCLWEL